MTVVYQYRASRMDGTIEEGSLDRESRDAAVAELSQRGLFALELVPAPPELLAKAMPVGEAAIGLRLLATLLAAGLPVGRALAAFEDVAPPVWKKGKAVIHDRVGQGDP